MKVACIIVNYNDFKTTEILVNHISNYQTIDNIIIVDNCSTNESFKRLSKFESDKIKVLRANMNNGYGAGNNIGLLYSKEKLNCDYAIIANPDVLFSENFVLKCVDFLVYTPDVGIVTGVMLNGNSEVEQQNVWSLPSACWEVFDASSILKRLFSFSKQVRTNVLVDSELEYVDVVSGSLFVLDINKFLEIGLFDEEVFLYGEENIIAIKMKRFKYKSVRILSINYNHFHSTSITKEYSKMFSRRKLMVRSKKIILRKYHKLKKWKLIILQLLLDLTLIEAALIEIIRNFKNKKIEID